jgi:CheY-like chemotaxis protein
VFDEWGRGYADGMLNPGDQQRPKIMMQERVLTKIDGSSKAVEFPIRGKGMGANLGSSAGSSDLTMKLNQQVTLKHTNGRVSLDFSSDGINYNFILGELFGDEVSGMPKPCAPSLSEQTQKKLNDANAKMVPVCDMYSSLKIDPSQKDTRPAMTIDTKSTLKDLMAGLNTLRASLTHPNLAKVEHKTMKWTTDPVEAEWSTELGLKRALQKQHPQCAGQTRKNWSIARMGGKCTDERLANTKASVVSPKTVQQISQLRLMEFVEETSGKGTLLVVICLATYAKEQSEYARLTAEKAQTELAERLGSESQDSVRFVLIELSECAGFADQFNIREAPPYYMMFRGGQPVQQHSEDNVPTIAKRLPGVRIRLHSESLVRPQVLLCEPNPAYQCKLERALRRAGYSSDLALDGAHALRLASRQQVYGVLLISSTLRADAVRSVISAVRRSEGKAMVIAYNSSSPSDEDPDARMRLLEECGHVFPAFPSYTGLQTVLSRCQVGHPVFGHGCSHKKDFCDEIQGVLEHGRGQSTIWGTQTLLPSQLAGQ